MIYLQLPQSLIDDILSLKESEKVENIQVGDKIHLGFGSKGGAGFTGHVKKVTDGMVVIQHPTGNEYIGHISRATKLEEPTDYYKMASRYFYRTEDVEGLNELSRETLKAYIKKAVRDSERKKDQYQAIDSYNRSKGYDITKDQRADRLRRKTMNRYHGINMAVDKL